MLKDLFMSYCQILVWRWANDIRVGVL